MSTQTNSSTASTWLQILEAIKVKTEDDFKTKLVPAVKTARSILGTVLVQIGSKIQPK